MDVLRELLPLWSSVESWAVRLFFFMGAMTLAPAILLVLFDAGMYVLRCLVLGPLGISVRGKICAGEEEEEEDGGEAGEKGAGAVGGGLG